MMNPGIAQTVMQNIQAAVPTVIQIPQVAENDNEKELQEIMRHIKEIKELLKKCLPPE